MLDKMKKDNKEEKATLTFEEIQKANEEFLGKLTHKNNQYIRQVDKFLGAEGWTEEKRSRHLFMILPAIIKAQAEGQPARRLLGTPNAYVYKLLHGDKPQGVQAEEMSPDWQVFVDGSLLLGGLFALVSGVTSLFNPGKAQVMGIISLLINFIVGGLMLLILNKNMPSLDPSSKKKQGWIRYIIVSAISATLWVLLISLSQSAVPASINPVLPPIAYILIAIAAFVGKYFFKRHFNVRTKTL